MGSIVACIAPARRMSCTGLAPLQKIARQTSGSAIDSVPRNLIRMAQSFDVPWIDIMRKIVFPGALPGILAAFRITASVALLLLVSAEMIGAQYGIGAFVLASGQLMQTDALLAGVVMLSVVGLIVGTTLSRLEKYLLRWR